MDKKLKEDLQTQADIQNDSYSKSEESLDKDFDRYVNEEKSFSDIPPSDFYQYKHMRLIPNSQVRFNGLVDKDTVLGNYKEKLPDPEYHRMIVETCVAFKQIFSVEKQELLADAQGNPIPIHGIDRMGQKIIVGYETTHVKVFDETFRVILDFLESGHKFEEVSSRAMGKTRESIMDRTQNISKEMKKPDDRARVG